jgi:hypothetical protein
MTTKNRGPYWAGFPLHHLRLMAFGRTDARAGARAEYIRRTGNEPQPFASARVRQLNANLPDEIRAVLGLATEGGR